MRNDLTEIAVVLDRSGSMQSVRQSTIDGFNEFVEGQKSVAGDANLTLVQFDSDNPYEVICDAKPIKDAPKLSFETFVPRGSTPLHDAIGKTVVNLGAKLGKLSEDQRPAKVVVVIVTDGYENCSKEYHAVQIADLIKQQREVYKWEFVFLGANQDAITTGQAMGISNSNSSSFDPSSGGVLTAFAASGDNLRAYRGSGDSTSLSYTKAQRASMSKTKISS